jgi:hypothetical protein
MSRQEELLTQIEKMLSGMVGAVASAIVRRRMPPDAVLHGWARRLRKAAELIEGYLHGS